MVPARSCVRLARALILPATLAAIGCAGPDESPTPDDPAVIEQHATRVPIPVEVLNIGVPPNRTGLANPSDLPCPGEDVNVYMDDEDDSNANDFYQRDIDGHWKRITRGPICFSGLCKFIPGGSSGAGLGNTSFRICKTAWQGPLPSLFTDYAVVMLDTRCPIGSKQFVKYWDNEDHNNTNSISGTAFNGTNNWVTNSASRMDFCFVPGTGQLPVLPPGWEKQFGIFAGPASNVPNGYEIGQGYQDDEDDNNQNSYSFWGSWTTDEMNRATSILSTNPTNSWMRIIRKNPDPPIIF